MLSILHNFSTYGWTIHCFAVHASSLLTRRTRMNPFPSIHPWIPCKWVPRKTCDHTLRTGPAVEQLCTALFQRHHLERARLDAKPALQANTLEVHDVVASALTTSVSPGCPGAGAVISYIHTNFEHCYVRLRQRHTPPHTRSVVITASRKQAGRQAASRAQKNNHRAH